MLAGLLWPDYSEEAARASLRQALHQIRTALGPDASVLEITPQTVQWNPADANCDVDEFLQLINLCKNHLHASAEECPQCIDRYKRIANLYGDDLLSGFSLKDSVAFEEWLMVKREQIRQLALETLETLTRVYEMQGEYEQMEQTARRQVEIDPFRESAHRQVMRALTWNKHRSEAMHHFNSLTNLLKEELGVEAESTTIALSKKIQAGQLKGKEKPTVIASSAHPYWYTSRPGAHPRPAFIDRKKELARLSDYLQKACSLKGQVVFVTGESGYGKTELLNEFVRRSLAAQEDLVVVNGNAMAYTGIGDPYLPFWDVLSRLAGDFGDQVSAGAMEQEQARRLWRQIPFLCQVILDVAPELIGTFLSGADLLRHANDYLHIEAESDAAWLPKLRQLVESKAGQKNGVEAPPQTHLFAQYVRVLKTLARRQPLALILDDLQWADEGTAGLLFYLGKQLANSRILLIGAYRPSDVLVGYSRDLRRQDESPVSRQIHPLEPVLNEFKRLWGEIEIALDQDEERGFIDELLDAEPNRLGSNFRETLFQQTRAYPLFAVELLHSLQEGGDLTRDSSGRWVEGSNLHWEVIPARVEAVIAERMRRLPGGLLEILKAASLEGEIFTAEVVAQVCHKDAFEVNQALWDELSQAHRLVQPYQMVDVENQTISQYRFRHILFQRYLYQNQEAAERLHLHKKVAEARQIIYGKIVNKEE